jgi:hypothetical protein
MMVVMLVVSMVEKRVVLLAEMKAVMMAVL